MIRQEVAVTRCGKSEVWVKAVKPPCQACRAPCGTPDDGETGPDGMAFSVVTDEGFSPGERVSIEVPEGLLLEASLLMYLLPLLGFLAGALLGEQLGRLFSPAQHEILAIAGGVVSLTLVYVLIHFLHAGRAVARANLSVRRLR